MRLKYSTWPKAQAYFKNNDMVIIGIGSIECHGTHLPLGTDIIIPDNLIDSIEQKSDIMIAPSIPYGACDYFMGFPGSISLGGELLYQVLSKIVDGLYSAGARKFIFLNGHGGNIPSLEAIGCDISKKGGLAAIMNWWLMAWEFNPEWKGGHAGGEETAAIMAICPESVDWQAVKDGGMTDVSKNIKAKGLKTVSFKNIELVLPRYVSKATDNGWVGPDHPNTATEEWGRNMLDKISEYIVEFIEEFKTAEIGIEEESLEI
ncbi:MAG: creatininase family protein [Lachnospiraceae bacterium]|nr:creatininase family protein [Lachnospiraceae bacterium]